MSNSPQPTPGWYPDPDMVDTVRYWDGNNWTEQRSPAQQSNPPSAAATATTPVMPKKSKKKVIVWSVVAAVAVLAVVLGISLKKAMDNTISNGVALADAYTITDQEMQDAGNAISDVESQAAPVEGSREAKIARFQRLVDVMDCSIPKVYVLVGDGFEDYLKELGAGFEETLDLDTDDMRPALKEQWDACMIEIG